MLLMKHGDFYFIMVKRIFLIRHGQTDWNLKGRYQGHSDTDLNANGKAQAKRLSDRLKGEKIEAVYASDRKRALNFAKIIFKSCPIKADPALREICFGVFEGLNYEEIAAKYPDIYAGWAGDPFGVKIPNGEDPVYFKNRVLNIFTNIVESDDYEAVAIVTHGGVINVIIDNIMKRESGRDSIPLPASLSIIEFKDGKPGIVLLNDMEPIKNG